MSAHSLLVMHNLSVLDAFFSGIRNVLSREGTAKFEKEMERFIEVYDESTSAFDLARKNWTEVGMARGKGRLAREKEKAKLAESALGFVVEI